MSRMLARPPAKMVHLAPQQSPDLSTSRRSFTEVLFGRMAPGDVPPPHRDLVQQSFGAVDSWRRYGGASAGSQDLRQANVYKFQDFQIIPPAHEQPRLDFTSGRQPFVRWRAIQRWSRTFMSASPRFGGRWAYVGYIQRQYAERPRLTGVATRLGTTYQYPRRISAPRSIILGGGQSG